MSVVCNHIVVKINAIHLSLILIVSYVSMYVLHIKSPKTFLTAISKQTEQ